MKHRAAGSKRRFALLLSLILGSAAATGAEQAPATLSITLRPLVHEGSLTGLAVEQTIEGVHADATTPLLGLPLARGLIAGSAAELAGLRNGDEISRPVPQDDIQGRQDGVLSLEIRRDNQPLRIAYVPRSEHVAAWQWERVPDVADSACAQ